MDDIASKLSQILNSPEGMEQLRSVAASLGLTENGGNTPPANNAFNNMVNSMGNNNMGMGNNNGNNTNNSGGLDLSAISSLLSGLGGGGNQQQSPPSNSASPPLPNIDLNTIMRLQQAMSQLSTSDKNVELLTALKSHFGTDRQKKVDDAIRIMQLIKLLPLIKETGIFGGGLF